MNTRKLKNPPIIEAVCEFRFELENINDPSIPGIIYSLIKQDFPIRKQRNIASPSLNSNSEVVITNLAQFYNQDETIIIQVGGDLLTINSVKKYPNWEIYKPEIIKILNVYLKEIKPKSLKRIGLRSINKIDVPFEKFDIDNFFTFAPKRPNNITSPYSHFNVHIESKLYDDRDAIVMKNSSILADISEKRSFILDLEYVLIKPNEVEMNFIKIEDWLDNAHSELFNAFQSSVTPSLMNTFDL